MKTNSLVGLVLALSLSTSSTLLAQRGYFDAPYTRYEANEGNLSGGATTLQKSLNQADIQFEASDRICVDMRSGGAVEWTAGETFRGIVMRFSVDINTTDLNDHFRYQEATANLYINDQFMHTFNLNTYYSWEMLSRNGNGNNVNINNDNWRMRFDETRHLLSQSYPAGTKIKIERTGGNLYIDFIEIEDVADPISAPNGSVTYTGSKTSQSQLQSFIDQNGGKIIYLPAGDYSMNTLIQINVDNTTLQGAGMWYTNMLFTAGNQPGGIWGNKLVHVKDMYLTTSRNSRSSSYKGINGCFGNGSQVANLWIEHFEAGIWIANYGGFGNQEADNLTITGCRIRNNYADGTNLCKGTKNSTVMHCSYRNNGDDDMAMWSQNGQQCYNNTYKNNTAELNWRSSSCALYGGHGNVWENIVVKDNWETGLKVNNAFDGYCYTGGTQNEMKEIDITGCGVWENLYRAPYGAVHLSIYNRCGDDVHNVKLSCLNIMDSKADAIMITDNGGDQFYDFSLENISINGTGTNNSSVNAGWGNGAGIRFVDNPAGTIEYCDITYNGIAGVNVDTYGQGSLAFNAKGGCASCSSSIDCNQANNQPNVGISNLTGTTHISCDDLSIDLQATGGTSYAWSDGLGYTADATIFEAGNYSVTATGINGCTASESIAITDEDLSNCKQPLMIHSYDDGLANSFENTWVNPNEATEIADMAGGASGSYGEFTADWIGDFGGFLYTDASRYSSAQLTKTDGLSMMINTSDVDYGGFHLFIDDVWQGWFAFGDLTANTWGELQIPWDQIANFSPADSAITTIAMRIAQAPGGDSPATIGFDQMMFYTNNGGIITGIDEEGLTSLNVYPNPANANAVQFSNRMTNVVVFNAAGKMVEAKSWAVGLDVSDYVNGMYFIKSDQGSVRLVVQK